MFDFKKGYKELYLPSARPSIVDVPRMNYLAVRGKGDPNLEEGEYKRSIGLLYAVAFTLKMSRRQGHRIEGYFDYVVPPLEGLWWQEGINGIDYSRKEDLRFISLIRLPDFVDMEDFHWAVEETTVRRKCDFSQVEFFSYEEGPSVQALHIGSYDEEQRTVELMHEFMAREGYELDITDERRHHEIYLSNARRVEAEKMRTVIRHPVRKIGV